MTRVQTRDTNQTGNRRKGQEREPDGKRTGHAGKEAKKGGKGQKKKGRKKGKGFVPYDYEKAYTQALADLDEWFAGQMLNRGAKAVYALKEIRAGEQFEVEIYPQFKSMDEVPEEGRVIKKDNTRAQRNLNDKNARKYVERLINRNFTNRDIWLTLTFDDAHLPPDGDIDAALRIIQNYFKRINRRRHKIGLDNAKYVYVIEYSPEADIRWHYHIVMDGALDMDTVEKCWNQGSRNEVRRLQKDENGLSGLANYIVKEKYRIKSEKRWNSSKGNLADPDIRVVHSKQPEKGKGNYRKIGKFVRDMVRDQDSIEGQMKKWYPEYDFTNAAVYYNDFNGMFYIHARMRKRRSEQNDEKTPWKRGKAT